MNKKFRLSQIIEGKIENLVEGDEETVTRWFGHHGFVLGKDAIKRVADHKGLIFEEFDVI